MKLIKVSFSTWSFETHSFQRSYLGILWNGGNLLVPPSLYDDWEICSMNGLGEFSYCQSVDRRVELGIAGHGGICL
jgi:hypothetical protein